MSFAGYKEKAEEGDTVLIFLGFDNMVTFQIEKNKTHQIKYGALHHKDLIGKTYGSKIQCSKGWCYLLHPTPELWTPNLPHRTQILYSTDISMVTFQLDTKPGAVVLEAGTGSGSLSHAIARCVGPNGHLYTFDFHQQRVETAQKEFEAHGLGSVVTVQQRDVCNDGFGLTNVADAVFLDLPLPWKALPHAKEALKPEGGRVCSFSPCIEQVQKTCQKLTEIGFVELQTLECLLRTFDVRAINMPMPDLGQPRGQEDVSRSQSGSQDDPVVGSISNPESKEETADSDKDGSEEVDEEDEEVSKQPKKQKTGKKDSTRKGKHTNCKGPTYFFKTGAAPTTMPGHTGYLTFATLYPE